MDVKIHKCLGRHSERHWPLPCIPTCSLEAVSPHLLGLLPCHYLQCSSYSRLVRCAAGVHPNLDITTGMGPVGQLSDISHSLLHILFSARFASQGILQYQPHVTCELTDWVRTATVTNDDARGERFGQILL